jgi:hypothetical protein
MTTEDIIKDLRYLCELPAHAGVSETMILAANAIEGLGLRFDECMQKHNNTRAELERLKTELAQAISERTPHDYGLLASQRDDYRDRLCASIKETQEARAEVERLKANSERLNQELYEAKGWRQDWRPDWVRKDPSRLEIAALLLANDRAYEGPTMALKRADALIAAAK